MSDLTKNVETRILYKKFKFRDYQKPIVDAIENKKFKKALVVLPRRAGKDICALQIAIRQALRQSCTIYYIFPTFSQARKAIYDAITIDGTKILDFIPDFLAKKNSSEMKITFINGSVLQFLGSTEYDRLRGSNPYMVIFSEYAYQNPMAYQTVRPILLANQGVAIFISTPYSKNHFYDLYQLAKNDPSWFCYKKTVDETRHISEESLAEEKASMSPDLFMQEYHCSFEQGVEGSYFAKYIRAIDLKDQLTTVPYEPAFPVHTSWDLGVSDYTSIVFFQKIGTVLHIIDYYENSDHGLDHYIKFLDTKEYKYGRHIAPHDIRNKSFSTGVSRIETARNLGVEFTIAESLLVKDGIEAIRMTIPKCYFDSVKCSKLLNHLLNYRKEWDSKRQMYKDKPFHGPESHGVDAFRMLSISLNKLGPGSSPDDLQKRYEKAYYGTSNKFNPLDD